MPIGSTNIKFSDLQTEFGGSNPISLSEYYRGGSNVPTSPTGGDGTTASGGVSHTVSNSTFPIPTSGAISIDKFKNTAKKVTIATTLTSNQTNFNLLGSIQSFFSTFTSAIVSTCTINSGVVSYATSTSNYGFNTGSGWTGDSTFALVNNGEIIGMGGAGSSGVSTQANAPAGSAGGSAMYLSINATITNGSGALRGGGGGGGAGGIIYGINYDAKSGAGGGGGGQSYQSSSGGNAGSTTLWPGFTLTTSATNGGSGTNSGAGSGGVGASQTDDGSTVATGGVGGAGGAYGAAGNSGSIGTTNTGLFPSVYNGGGGGAAGYYLNKNGYTVTWVSNGTRNGSEV